MKIVSLKRVAKLTSAALAALLLSACQKPLSFEEPVLPPLTVSISSLLRFPVHYSGTEKLIYEFNPQIPGFY